MIIVCGQGPQHIGIYAYPVLGSRDIFFSFGSNLAASQNNCVCTPCPRFINLSQQNYNSVGGKEREEFCKLDRAVAPECQPFKVPIPLLYLSIIIEPVALFHFSLSLLTTAVVICFALRACLDFPAFKLPVYPCTATIINTVLLSEKAHSCHWAHLMFTIKTIKYNPILALFSPVIFKCCEYI